MDDSNGHRLQTLTKANSFKTTAAAARSSTANNGHFQGGFCMEEFGQEEDEENNGEGQGDTEVWGTFTESFRQVQSVLDRNRVLIQQVNENHQSKIHDNLVKNVALIQEINGNISKVVSLYSDLSVNFSSLFHQGSPSIDAKNNNSKGDSMQA
uniref:Protein EARLY FLOWERING 4 domain-containing protein n=1 Tax=Davidia involucrata TaxID=16924 RepID=A0A5B7C3U6_DAVIN